MKRPTQADVARLAGVSRATVSNVMNGRTEEKIPISADTRKRVLDAVAKLKYTPDFRAQSLRSGSTKTVGVLLAIYENPFFWEILTGISAEAGLQGYSVLLPPGADMPQREQHLLRELAQQRVDGLILLSSTENLSIPVAQQLRQSSKPIVQISAANSEVDHVHHGYVDGTRQLMKHLFDLGHRRIGFVYGVSKSLHGEDRLQTYRDVMNEAGINHDSKLIAYCGATMEDGYKAAKQLLSRDDRPTALMVINDLLGIATLRAAADLGLRVPEDVSVAGFDDIPFSSYSVPRLTTISGNPHELGRTALQLLLKRIKDPERPQEIIHIDTTLVIRESTGPVPYQA